MSLETWNGILGSDVSDLTNDSNYPDAPDVVSSFISVNYSGDQGDDIGQRVRGYIHAPTTGPYRFAIASDETAEFWLSNSGDSSGIVKTAHVDTATDIQQWDVSSTQQSDEVLLAAGQKYYFEILHKESSGNDHLSLGWTTPQSTSFEVVPSDALSAVLPSVQIYSETPKVAEGSGRSMTYQIVRSGVANNNPLTVHYSLSGEAINGTDYLSLPGTITIPAGSDSVDLIVAPTADSIVEGDESLVIEIEKKPAYTVGYKSERTAHGILQDDVGTIAGGDSLWNGQSLSDFQRFGGTFTTESDPTFGAVIQSVIDGTQNNPWESQLRQSIDAPVTAGDILWVSFWARTTSGTGTVDAIFEQNGATFTKSLNQGISLDSTWSKIQIPFVATDTYAVGGASFGFHLAHGAQTFQFTDFEVLNYGPPQSLAPETSFDLFNIGGSYGSSQYVAITGQPFPIAFEAETITPPPVGEAWRFQAAERNEGVVASGDTMRFEFAARAVSGSSPEAAFSVQRTDTFATLFSQSLPLTSAWQTFSFDVVAGQNFSPGDLQAVFFLGQGVQTVQIGGFDWSNINNSANLDDLPTQFPATSYGGRSGSATWRKTADTGIQNNRMSNVTINVTDINGQPLDGAVVSLRQSEHEFKFGSAISNFQNRLSPTGNETALKYQSEIKRLFNTVVLENSLKWPQLLNDRQRGLDGAEFATNNELYQRGHNVIWPSREFMPNSVWAEYDQRVVDDGLTDANTWLRTTIEARIDDVLTTFDDITEWDVVNEPFSNRDVMDILGDSIVLDWYQRMRDANANIKLVLNDFNIFADNGGDTDHRASFDGWLGLLNDANLLDIIGEQSHYNESNLTDIDSLSTLINTYNTLVNKPIAITEFDVNTQDEQLQADYLRDYMTLSFSESAIDEFVLWGFWQDAHWLPDAALYRNDFSIKPNGQAYEDLVFGNWWTDARGTTRGGAFATDAFLGDHDVFVQYNGQTYIGTIVVNDSGTSSLTINVPEQPINYSPTEVIHVQINDGSDSRSQITSLTVTFDNEVDHSELNSAFEITNIDSNTSVGQIMVDPSDANGQTTAILSFAGASVQAPRRHRRIGELLGGWKLSSTCFVVTDFRNEC